MPTVPRPPMQISAIRRPASIEPGTFAPASISRLPSGPIVTASLSRAASAARPSTRGRVSPLTLGRAPFGCSGFAVTVGFLLSQQASYRLLATLQDCHGGGWFGAACGDGADRGAGPDAASRRRPVEDE